MSATFVTDLGTALLSAIVPTAVAQRWFAPDAEAERAAEAHRLPTPHTRVPPADHRLTG